MAEAGVLRGLLGTVFCNVHRFESLALAVLGEVDAPSGCRTSEYRQVEVDDRRAVGVESLVLFACLDFDYRANGGGLYAELGSYLIVVAVAQRADVAQLGLWQECCVEGVVVDYYV